MTRPLSSLGAPAETRRDTDSNLRSTRARRGTIWTDARSPEPLVDSTASTRESDRCALPPPSNRSDPGYVH